MEYVVIFTFGDEKYAVVILAVDKEQAILDGCKIMRAEYRHFDAVECVNMLIN